MIEFETTRGNHTTVIEDYGRTKNLMFWKPADNYMQPIRLNVSLRTSRYFSEK